MYFNLDSPHFDDWTNPLTLFVNILNTAQEKICAYTINAVEHFLFAVISYVIVCLLLYKIINRGYGLRYESSFKNAKRALFVIAHPDDECMFFGPTIYKLTREAKCQVYLLCLSTGDKDGLGKTRKPELFKSCKVLGIKEENIVIYNCTVLPDDPTIRWREDVIANIILQHIEALDIDTLITFDKHGVSRHSNHCSIYYAVAYLSMEKKIPHFFKIQPNKIPKIFKFTKMVPGLYHENYLPDRTENLHTSKHNAIFKWIKFQADWASGFQDIGLKTRSDCKIYTLESINVLRKYWLILDIPTSFILSTHRYILKWPQRETVIHAMKQHESQYVWFRKLYVRFSRYMIINTFQQLDMIDLELDLSLDD